MVARELVTDRGTLRWLEAGEGRPLVLLHAFPLSGAMWLPQLERPPHGWRLVAPDLRGFRRPDAPPADAPPTPWTMEDYAADVEALVAALGARDVALGGLSMGGYVAMALLRRGRVRPAALLLADTRAEADTEEARAGRRRLQGVAEREGSPGVAREMLPKLLGETTRARRPEIVAGVRTLIEANAPAALRAALEAMMGRPDSTDVLRRLDVPALIVVGEEDTVTPPETAERLSRAVPDSRLVTVGGAGHLSNLENPEAFGAALEEFLVGCLA
ncbi:MAG TPA: alpha/beta fold hydrolase [Vicinamibacterales bacterium]|nr:alpha/beta fold hydrolase [Vicinamibacterales bacterium]